MVEPTTTSAQSGTGATGWVSGCASTDGSRLPLRLLLTSPPAVLGARRDEVSIALRTGAGGGSGGAAGRTESLGLSAAESALRFVGAFPREALEAGAESRPIRPETIAAPARRTIPPPTRITALPRPRDLASDLIPG